MQNMMYRLKKVSSFTIDTVADSFIIWTPSQQYLNGAATD
jgi:hypothetical protein